MSQNAAPVSERLLDEGISGQNVPKPKSSPKRGRPKGTAAKIADDTGLSKKTVLRALKPPPDPAEAKARKEAAAAVAAEIRIRAERRLGQIIKQQKETVGLNRGGWPSCGVAGEPQVPTLADAGIDKKLSSRAQKSASIPEDKYEALISEWRERVEKENERVTTNIITEAGRRQSLRR